MGRTSPLLPREFPDFEVARAREMQRDRANVRRCGRNARSMSRGCASQLHRQNLARSEPDRARHDDRRLCKNDRLTPLAFSPTSGLMGGCDPSTWCRSRARRSAPGPDPARVSPRPEVPRLGGPLPQRQVVDHQGPRRVEGCRWQSETDPSGSRSCSSAIATSSAKEGSPTGPPTWSSTGSERCSTGRWVAA